jgi:hypothetical protein
MVSYYSSRKRTKAVSNGKDYEKRSEEPGAVDMIRMDLSCGDWECLS